MVRRDDFHLYLEIYNTAEYKKQGHILTLL